MIEVDNPNRFINPRSTFGDATFLGGSKFTTNVVPLWKKSEEAEIFTHYFEKHTSPTPITPDLLECFSFIFRSEVSRASRQRPQPPARSAVSDFSAHKVPFGTQHRNVLAYLRRDLYCCRAAKPSVDLKTSPTLRKFRPKTFAPRFRSFSVRVRAVPNRCRPTRNMPLKVPRRSILTRNNSSN
jgi:hypothetical protein